MAPGRGARLLERATAVARADLDDTPWPPERGHPVASGAAKPSLLSKPHPPGRTGGPEQNPSYRLRGAEGWDLAAVPRCPAEGEIATVWSPLPGEPPVRIRQRVGDSGLGAAFASVPHTPRHPGGGSGGGQARAFSKPHTSGRRCGLGQNASYRLGGAEGWGLAPARSPPTGPNSR